MNATSAIITKLTTDKGLNYFNIALMVLSVIAAYIIPFELFLFSYAVLGPLHYLTEISWLEKKNYFIKSKSDIWVFLLLVVFITIGLFNRGSKTNLFIASFLFSAFVYALIILFVENKGIKILLVFIAFIVSIAFKFNHFPDFPFILFAVWLPTIIHVYIFTGLFLLYGALKSRSKSGILSVVVFITCALVFFIYTPDHIGIPVSNYGREAYSFFTLLNRSLYQLFGYGDFHMNDEVLFFGAKSIIIMRFIAFAYTYHYLNWFSKTTVIKWNDVSKKRMGIIITLWILSVALYAFSYKTGFYALFLLSMLHVFLEFPLNYRSFIGIGQEVKEMVKK
jgi:hypothetical protein